MRQLEEHTVNTKIINRFEYYTLSRAVHSKQAYFKIINLKRKHYKKTFSMKYSENILIQKI